MYNNVIYFGFQSIFILFGVFTSFAFILSYLNKSKNSLIFLVTFLFILLIVYFINFLKKSLVLDRISFIYFSLIGWLLIILVSSIPLFELLSNSNLNQIIFYATSHVTTSGFNINTEQLNNKFILSLWVAIMQNIGALYTLLLFVIYSNIFFSGKILDISKKNIIKLHVLYLFFLFLYFLFIFSNDYNFFMSLSIASSIISSTGLKTFNSVFLSNDTNYIIVTLMMLMTLLILPIIVISNSKEPLKVCIRFFIKNKLNIYFFIFLILFLLLLFHEINIGIIKKLFFIVSLVTTTGVLPADFQENIFEFSFNKYLLVILFVSVIGSFSGTTNGGLKINKLSLFFINLKEELNKFLFQHNIKGVNIIKKGSSQNELNTFYALMIFSSILILISIIFLNITGIDLRTSLIYLIASLSNTGESLLIVNNISERIKADYYFLLNFFMICGKYEFIGYFLIFNKIFKLRKLI